MRGAPPQGPTSRRERRLVGAPFLHRRACRADLRRKSRWPAGCITDQRRGDQAGRRPQWSAARAPVQRPAGEIRARSITTLLTTLLGKTGLLDGDLDYHLLRASMVMIFLFFGYQKWWDYEGQTLIPFISNGPLISWMYPRIWHPGRELVPRSFGVVVWRPHLHRLLEQNPGSSRGCGLVPVVHHDHHHHSIHAGRVGCVRPRISCDDGHRSLPDEGRGSPCRIGLPAEARCSAGIGRPRHKHLRRPSAPGHGSGPTASGRNRSVLDGGLR